MVIAGERGDFKSTVWDVTLEKLMWCEMVSDAVLEIEYLYNVSNADGTVGRC